MIRIKEANKSDIPLIIDFQIDMARETEKLELNRETLSKGVEAIFDANYKGKYYIAEYDGQTAGMLMTTFEWSDWRAATVLWIQSVFVKPAFRKKGVYSALYQHVQKIVKQNPNYGGIRLYVDQGNQQAIKVYEKAGMDGGHYKLFEWMTSPEDQQRHSGKQ